jgi:membrane-associated protease RseP (regulator of RpoE activity)
MAIPQFCCSIGAVRADDATPVFELDCVGFEGRFLANAPVKKKVHPGLGVDGTVWAMSPDGKQVLVTQVVPGEAAEKAGIESGDEIVSINGYPTTGSQLRDLFRSYHMYDPATMTETLIVKKKDGTQKTHKLHLLTLDACNADEKRGWLEIYKSLGY